MKKINDVFFLRPWAIKEDVLAVMIEIVERHLKGEKLSHEEIIARIGSDKKDSPDYEVINGVAQIPVYGIIAKRMSMVNGISQPRGTSVEEIERNFTKAVKDDNVEKILLDIDSPGGSVDGIDELSELIYESRGTKPIIAFANGMMASAAYYIGSAADKVYASKSAEVGSIGVYTVLQDLSVMAHNMGMKTEIIRAGKYKATGHPLKPLTEDDRAVVQTEIDKYFELFTDAIKRNRGFAVDEVAAVANGKVFIGREAVEMGLVDGIERFDTLLRSAGKSSPKTSSATAKAASGVQIDKDKTQQPINQEENMDITIESLKANHKAVADALIAEGKQVGITEGKAVGLAEGEVIGAQKAKDAEALRVKTIMEAMPQGMEAVALSAIKEAKTAEETKDMYLKAMKKEAPSSPGANADPAAATPSNLSIEEKAGQEFDKDPALQAEFGKKEDYIRFKKAEAEGRIKILKK